MNAEGSHLDPLLEQRLKRVAELCADETLALPLCAAVAQGWMADEQDVLGSHAAAQEFNAPGLVAVALAARLEHHRHRHLLERLEQELGASTSPYPWTEWALASAALTQGSGEKIKEALEQALRYGEHHSLSWLRVAQAYEDAFNDVENSLRCYRKAIELDDRNARAWVGLGILLTDNDPDRAEAALTTATEIDGDLAVAWVNLGHLRAAKNHYRKAEDAYSRAAESEHRLAAALHNQARMVLRTGRVRTARSGRAQKLLARAIQMEPHNDHLLMDYGVALLQRGRAGEAIETFRQALECKTDAVAYAGLGLALAMGRQHAEAVAAFRKANELAPEADATWLYLASELTEDDPLEAIACYGTATEINPRCVDAWMGLARVQEQRKDANAAESTYRAGLLANPNDLELLRGLARLLAADTKRAEEAKETYEQILDLDPKDAAAWVAIARLHRHHLDDPASAERAYQRALELHSDGDVWRELGEFLESRDRLAAAEDAYLQATEKAPKTKANWMAFGKLLKRTGRSEEAREAWQRGIRFDPRTAKISSWKAWAQTLAELELYDEASNAYQHCRNLNPNDDQTWMAHARMYADKVGDHQRAVEIYREGIGVVSDPYVLWTKLSTLLRVDMKDYEAAEQALQQCVKLQPVSGWCWSELGLAMEAQGRHLDAEKAYQKSIAVQPAYKWAHANLGNLYRVKMVRLRDAEKAYREAIRVDQDYVRAWNELGLVYIDMNRLDAAEECFHRCIRTDPKYQWAYRNLGVVCRKRNDYANAERWFLTALQLDPKYVQCWGLLGDLYSKDMDLPEKAIESLHRCLAENPTYTRGWNSLGQALMANEEFDKAERAYLKAIEVDPQYKWAHANLGKLYRVGLERCGDAEIAYRTALQIDPKYVWAMNDLALLYLQDSRLKEAETTLLDALAVDPAYKYTYRNLARTYQLQRDFDKSEEFYRKAIEQDPKSPGWRSDFGVMFENKGDLKQAEANLRKAIEIDAKHSRGWNELGLFLHRHDRLDEAAETFRHLTQIAPDYKYGWRNLGIVCESKSEFEQAEQYLRQSLQLDPEYRTAWLDLCDVVAKQGRVEEAESVLRSTIEKHSGFASGWNALGMFLRDQDRYDEAIGAYQKALEVDPKYKWAAANLGRLYRVNLEQFDEAEKAYRQALDLDPDYVWCLADIGALMNKLERLPEAESYLRRGQAIEPLNSSLWHNLGKTHQLQGNLEEAQRHFLRAIELKPSFDRTWYELAKLSRQCNLVPDRREIYEATTWPSSRVAKTMNNIAWLHFSEDGVLEDALWQAREAVKHAPESTDYWHTLSCVLAASSLWDDAEAAVATWVGQVDAEWLENRQHFLQELLNEFLRGGKIEQAKAIVENLKSNDVWRQACEVATAVMDGDQTAIDRMTDATWKEIAQRGINHVEATKHSSE